MNVYAAKSYLSFLLKSQNQHGVHSPFVYNLVTKCFYDRSKYKDYEVIKKYRNQLISNNEIIEIEDFGSGSKKFRTNNRKISSFSKTSGASIKKAFLLFRLANYFNSKNILELGTALGMATFALAVSNKNVKITTIEGSKNLADFTIQILKNYNIANVELINNQFKYALPALKKCTWDLIFVDGHHDKTATINYFEMLLPSLHNDTVIIFDDIHWSEEMTVAWKTIIKHSRVTVSIDTFYFGLVFFRKEQTKEHFYIRL